MAFPRWLAAHLTSSDATWGILGGWVINEMYHGIFCDSELLDGKIQENEITSRARALSCPVGGAIQLCPPTRQGSLQVIELPLCLP